MSRRWLVVFALMLNVAWSALALAVVPAVGAATVTVCAVGCDYTTIQAAIGAANSGDTITVGPGTYAEQVVIGKNLTITGAGAGATTILAPAVVGDGGPGGEVVLVQVDGGAVVAMSGFTIAGPAQTCDLDGYYGVFVVGGANLALSDSTIRDIRPSSPPLTFGCGVGSGVRVGADYLAPAGVGTATLTRVQIGNYEKTGLVVDGVGANATMAGSTIAGVGSNTIIAQNGVQISRGATATLVGNTIGDNLCDRVGTLDDPACGPGQIQSPMQTQATGLLLYNAANVTLTGNTIAHNDVGLLAFADTPPAGAVTFAIDGNAFAANRYQGLLLSYGTATVTGNDITGASNVGVQVTNFGNAATAATLRNNRIADAGRGVQISDPEPADAFGATASGEENSLAGNGTGVDNQTAAAANFAGNWWGSPSGPQSPANPGGTGVPIVGNVLFAPPLGDGIDYSAARGFQPGTLTVGLAPSSLTFAAGVVGTTSAAQAVALTNTGSEPVAITVITISGDFAQTNTCPASLAPGANCAIDVTFTPTAAGSRTGTLTIFDNAAGSPQNVALGGTGTAAPGPDPSPATYTVSATTIGSGTISPSGTANYAAGTLATYAATAAAGQVFLGWTLDGVYVGFASPLDFTVGGNRSLVAEFAPRPTFADVPTTDADHEAITFLAALGVINPQGVNGSGQFQPNRDVVRAEMASFVARVFDWQREFHANAFPDKCDPAAANCVDDELWNNVAALADYGVVGGYTDPATCVSAGTVAPCYLPRDPVLRVQVVSIVARAFIKAPDLRPTGFWDRLAADPAQYTNVPDTGTQRSDLTTYTANAGVVPGQASAATFQNPTGNGTRRFVIQALYRAFAAWYGTDRTP